MDIVFFFEHRETLHQEFLRQLNLFSYLQSINFNCSEISVLNRIKTIREQLANCQLKTIVDQIYDQEADLGLLQHPRWSSL